MLPSTVIWRGDAYASQPNLTGNKGDKGKLMNPHMIEPRCLINGDRIRRLFPDIFLGGRNGFVWTRELLLSLDE